MTTELNQPAPEFTLPDLSGRIHLLSDYHGNIVIVNFWSAECPHAKRVDASITTWLDQWGADVTLLSIASNANESEELITSTAAHRKIPVLLRDTDQSVADRYDAQTTPHVFVIDRQGILRYRGAADDVAFRKREPTQYYLNEAVKALQNGQLPEINDVQPFGCSIVRFV